MAKELPASVVRYHPDRLAGALGWSAIVPLLLMPAFSLPLGWIVGAVLAISAFYLRVIGDRIEGALERHDDELRITGASDRRFAVKDVESVHVVPKAGGAEVVLELAGRRRLVTPVPAAEDGDRLLAGLGFDATKRKTRIALAAPGRRIALGVLATLLSVVGTAVLFAILLYAAPAWLLWCLTLGGLVGAPLGIMAVTRPPVVTVGSDGVLIERSVGRRRFVPLSAITGVELTQRGFTLLLREGRPITVSQGLTGAHRAAAVRRIEAALEARDAREGEAERRRAERLARDGRSVQGWREHLRAQLAHDDYRSAGLRPEDAEATLTRVDLPLEQRVGATLALASHDRGRAREKVRIALEATVDDHARAALEAALEEEDAAVEEALAAAARRG